MLFDDFFMSIFYWGIYNMYGNKSKFVCYM